MQNTERRKIHIDIPQLVHQKLRVKAAYEDVSIQEFVSGLIAAAVTNVELPKQNVMAKKGKK